MRGPSPLALHGVALTSHFIALSLGVLICKMGIHRIYLILSL